MIDLSVFSFFDIDQVFITVLGYAMSYVEFFGTIAGFIAVLLAARGNVWSWPIGIINVILLFFLFYQVQLYPDMFLQIFFFITNLAGWWRWKNPKKFEADHKEELKVSFLSHSTRLLTIGMILIGTTLMGFGAAKLHQWFPSLFSIPSSFPYADSFVTITSIAGQYWMLHKKAECWILWILADTIATVLYFQKGILFLSLEYLVFCFMALAGFLTWSRQFRNYGVTL